MADHKLTAQQQRYVEEYCQDPSSQKNAAIRAGYSPETAKESASRLMRHPLIKQEIEDRMGERTAKMGVTPERVLQELCLIAFANMQDVTDQDEEGNTTVNVKNLKREVAASLAELTITTKKGKTTVQTSKIRLADKLAALEKIGKFLGMFKEKIEHSGVLSLEELVKGSLEEKSEPEEEINLEDLNGSSSGPD